MTQSLVGKDGQPNPDHEPETPIVEFGGERMTLAEYLSRHEDKTLHIPDSPAGIDAASEARVKELPGETTERFSYPNGDNITPPETPEKADKPWYRRPIAVGGLGTMAAGVVAAVTMLGGPNEAQGAPDTKPSVSTSPNPSPSASEPKPTTPVSQPTTPEQSPVPPASATERLLENPGDGYRPIDQMLGMSIPDLRANWSTFQDNFERKYLQQAFPTTAEHATAQFKLWIEGGLSEAITAHTLSFPNEALTDLGNRDQYVDDLMTGQIFDNDALTDLIGSQPFDFDREAQHLFVEDTELKDSLKQAIGLQIEVAAAELLDDVIGLEENRIYANQTAIGFYVGEVHQEAHLVTPTLWETEFDLVYDKTIGLGEHIRESKRVFAYISVNDDRFSQTGRLFITLKPLTV